MKNLSKLSRAFNTSPLLLPSRSFCLGILSLLLVSAQQVDCQSFTCGCTGSGVLNIDASPASPHYNPTLGGTLYSVLEAAFNLTKTMMATLISWNTTVVLLSQAG